MTGRKYIQISKIKKDFLTRSGSVADKVHPRSLQFSRQLFQLFLISLSHHKGGFSSDVKTHSLLGIVCLTFPDQQGVQQSVLAFFRRESAERQKHPCARWNGILATQGRLFFA